jgi:hypothetical protein
MDLMAGIGDFVDLMKSKIRLFEPLCQGLRPHLQIKMFFHRESWKIDFNFFNLPENHYEN